MSGRFGSMRGFAWTMASVMSTTFIAAALADPSVPNTYALALSPVPLLALGVYALSRVDNHGRGRTPTSGLQRGAARLFVGPIKPCGCWKDTSHLGSGTDAESIECDYYVARHGGSGGRVRFEARKNVLKRCYECGRHYHVDRSAKLRRVGDVDALAEIGDGDRHSSTTFWRAVDVWPEDEPAAREAFTAPVEDREVKA